MSEIGDSFDFLKRKHMLVEDDVIHIQQNPRHYEKLFEVVGIYNFKDETKENAVS